MPYSVVKPYFSNSGIITAFSCVFNFVRFFMIIWNCSRCPTWKPLGKKILSAVSERFCMKNQLTINVKK